MVGGEKPSIVVQYARRWPYLPDEELLKQWALAALAGRPANGELVIRIVDEQESSRLNRRWRAVDRATNVLSFPAGEVHGPAVAPLGDLALCAPVVDREAHARGTPPLAHWAHVEVHGILHLLGYDHAAEQDAARMEALETKILHRLNFPSPYTAAENDQER